jgi:hypothetical protein
MESAEKQTVTPTLAKKSNPFFSKGEEETFFQGPSKATSFFKGGSGLSAGAPTVQTKLTIGQPNDLYELEADKAADAFVQRKASAPAAPPDNPSSNTSHSTPFVIRRCEKCDAEKEKKIMKSAYGASMEGSASKAPSVSMDEASGTGEAGIIRRCAACDAKRDKLDRKALTPEVQREAAGGQASGGQAPGSQDSGGQTSDGQASGGQAGTLESSLQSSKGSGVALPAQTRQDMESHFGADFSQVRIHNNAQAVQMSQDLQAHAFTYGNDIYFNSGKYDTNSSSGNHLLAHELTHVVQQGSGPSIHKSAMPDIMRASLLDSTLKICQRVLISPNHFRVGAGGAVRINIQTDKMDTNIPDCADQTYHVTLTKHNSILKDDEISTCNALTGTSNSFVIGHLAEGEYYVTIYRDGGNPNCCITGTIQISDESADKVTASDSQCTGGDNSVDLMDASQKIDKAIHYAMTSDSLTDEAKEQLKYMLDPAAIATMVGFATLFLLLQTNPFGWAADTLLIIGGLATIVGGVLTLEEAKAVVDHLGAFAKGAMNAHSDADLKAAGKHLATAVAKAGIDIVLAILLHKAGKAAKKYIKPKSPAMIQSPEKISMPDGKQTQITPDDVINDKSLGEPETKPNDPQPENKPPQDQENKPKADEENKQNDKDKDSKPKDMAAWIAQQYADIAEFRKNEKLPVYDQANGDTGTISKLNNGSSPVWGENSGMRSSGIELRKKGFNLIKGSYPKAKFWSQVNYLTHAEAHALLQAWESGLVKEHMTMFVDRPTCNMCIKGIGVLMKALGIKSLDVYSGGSFTPFSYSSE